MIKGYVVSSIPYKSHAETQKAQREQEKKLIFSSKNFSAVCIKDSRDRKLEVLCELCLSAPLREKPMGW